MSIKDLQISSEIQDILVLMDKCSALTKYYLISAYDMFYKALPKPSELPRTDLIFIDSGGYEVSKCIEGNADLENAYSSLPWDEKKYYDVLNEWHAWDKNALLPAIITSYDHPDQYRPFEDQIDSALSLKRAFPDQLYNFLLKPETEKDSTYNKVINHKLKSQIDKLALFDIIGLTEKELGSSIKDRCNQISNVRKLLDEAGINKPIHVFGGLDPTLIVLYYGAGAEIFDGVSWSRYQYHAGVSTYHYNFNINDMLCTREESIKIQMMVRNLNELSDLETKLATYKKTGDFTHFNYMQDTYQRLMASL